MNLPNKLSVIRVFISIIMIIISYIIKDPRVLSISLAIIFILGSITDLLDGKIARKKNLITDFGKFIDPLADKVLVLTALVIMVETGKIPAWIPIIVLIREFAVTGFRLVAASKKGNVIAASKWGKIKTTTQMIGITLILFSKYNFFEFVNLDLSFSYFFNLIASITILVSVIATIFSGYDYLKHGKYLLKDA